MAKSKKNKVLEQNKAREERILMEVVVDAYGEEERAMSWYYYLEAKLKFPFLTTCKVKRAISPLQVGDEVELTSMAPEEECQREIFVMTPWEKDGLAVPLSQLEFLHGDDETRDAMEDWAYWVEMGYQF